MQPTHHHFTTETIGPLKGPTLFLYYIMFDDDIDIVIDVVRLVWKLTCQRNLGPREIKVGVIVQSVYFC